MLTNCGSKKHDYDNPLDELRDLSLKKIRSSNFDELFDKSKYVVVGQYKELKNVIPHELSIINFQVELTHLADLKGSYGSNTLYINVHSPGVSGFGHYRNYNKRFVVFLGEDVFNDKHFVEGSDFLGVLMIDKFEVSDGIYGPNN